MFTGGASGLDALGRLERWTIDPTRRRVDRRVLDDTPQEFPRINERHVAARHRFLITVSVPPDGNTQLVGATRIYCHELETGERQEHDFGDGHLPGEFVFVPDGVGEATGWLMGFVLNVAEATTDFVRLPHAIPPGFHGNWFTD